MLLRSFLLLLASIAVFHSCKKHDIPEDTTPPKTCEDTISIYGSGKMENGYLKAVNTCRDWLATGWAKQQTAPSPYLTIYGNTYISWVKSVGDTTLVPKEYMTFYCPNAPGKYPVKDFSGNTPLTNFAMLAFSRWDFDVMVADWVIDDTFADNYLEITEIDIFNKRVKGHFNLHLRSRSGASSNNYPSRLHFYDGAIDVKIID